MLKGIITNLGAFGAALAIFAANLFIIYPLFRDPYTQYLGAIECAYMTYAKFIVENFPHLTWNFQWYTGFPFGRIYMPLFPGLLSLLHVWFDLPISVGYRGLAGVCYSLAPVSLYFFIRYTTKRDFAAFVGAAAYSILPSVAYLFRQEYAVAYNVSFAPKTFIALTIYGEGPHVMALALAPLAALAFMRMLKKPAIISFALAVMSLVAMALTSMTALQGCLVILFIILASELPLGNATQKLLRAFSCWAISAGLIAFWYTLPFIKGALQFAGGSGFARNIYLLVLPGLPIAAASLLILRFKPHAQPVIIAAGATAFFVALLVGRYWLEVTIVLFAERYIPEMDMMVAMLIGLAAEAMRKRCLAPNRTLLSISRQGLVLIIFLMALTWLARSFLRNSWSLSSGRKDLSDTTEYQVAKWLEGRAGEARVFATGNHAFWMNFFVNVFQIRGGADWASANPWWDHVTYLITAGNDANADVLWARALNVRYLVVNYPESIVPYKDYAHPAKYESMLALRYSEAGDKIFEVPLHNAALAQVVDLRQLSQLPPIKHVLDDTSRLRLYVETIKRHQGDTLRYELKNSEQLLITGKVRKDEGILVKTSYHHGWKAFANGKRLRITPDPVHFLLIEPDSSGDIAIELRHDRTIEDWTGYVITAFTIILVLTAGPRFFRRISAPPPAGLRE